MIDRELEQGVAALCGEIAPVYEHEQVALSDARCRVLARDLIAPYDVPAFDNSAMDGFALRSTDCAAPGATTLHVAGKALAGHAYASTIAAGEAVRVTTGAPMPAGADSVVMQEDVQPAGDRITFTTRVRAGMHVRPRGEQMRNGDRLVAAGTVLRAEQIGLAVAAGAARLEVVRALHVGIVSTGDELFDPPAPLAASGSYDANRPLLHAACRSAGFTVTDFGVCADRAADFAAVLERAGEARVDALVVSGGSALGDADFVRKAAGVRFVPFNIYPGRGLAFGTIAGPAGSYPMLGLPGNAVSTFVMFHFVAMPLLLHRAGSTPRLPVHVPLPLAEAVQGRRGVVDYRRGRFERDSRGVLGVRPLAQQGAGMVRTLADADVLMAVGADARYAVGDPIPVVPLASLPR